MNQQEIEKLFENAPEGCTHYVVGSVSPFEKRVGDDWFFWSRRGCFWEKLHIYSGNDRIEKSGLKIVERPSPAWSGEGLPPVGVRCEAAIPHTSGPDGERSFIWIEGSVIAYYEINGKTYAWFAEDDGFYPPNVLEFRPIRTLEQIAADEREAAIRAIVYDLQDAENLSSLPSIANCLYGKGYRKP